MDELEAGRFFARSDRLGGRAVGPIHEQVGSLSRGNSQDEGLPVEAQLPPSSGSTDRLPFVDVLGGPCLDPN